MMKSNRILIIAALTAMAPIFFATSLRADDWKTTDGKVYQDVKVISVSPDTVTILHQDGGASVPLASLTPDLQKRFYYDPAKAQAAAEDRAKKEEAAKEAMREREQEAEQLMAVDNGQNSSPSAPDSSTPTGPIGTPTATSTSQSSSSSDFVDTLTSSPLQVTYDSTHHPMSFLSPTALSLRRDLSDPTYHTMAHAAYEIRTQGLGPDKSDPNHHTMDEIAH